VRIVIAEDSVLLREGLTRLFADYGEEVVAGVDNADAACAAVAEHHPDLILLDVRMPPNHTDEGIRAALAIRASHPEVAILVLSQYVEQHYAAELLAGDTAGVGYLLKDRVADVRDFVADVRRVAAGGTALDPEVVSHLLAHSRRQDPLARLTPRETEVLELMAQGRTNAAIAAQMVVGEGAVEKHVSSIFAKLDLAPADTDHRRVLAVLRYLEA
jgi:DNA-binding NarL/FixJ family response regulator